MEDIKETLSNTLSSNQLVQACTLYSNLKYVQASLKCIAWFTYQVTLPFLNMCELINPSDLLTLLPNLAKDLATGDYETLKDYHVDYSFKVEEPTKWDTKGNRKWYVRFVRKHLHATRSLLSWITLNAYQRRKKNIGDIQSVKTSKRSKRIK